MHYPRHITALCTALWILQGDAYAAKSGFNAEVLTSFAKNVASILSTTLLSEYQDQSPDQLSSSLLKNIQDHPSLLNIDSNENQSSEDPSTLTRHARSSKEVRGAFQDAYVTSSPPGYTKYYNPEPYKPYEYAIGHNTRVTANEANIKAISNLKLDTRDNSIDTDINAASIYYSDRYQHSPGLRYNLNSIHSSANSNPYANFAFQPGYHRSPPQNSEGSGQSSERGVNGNENPQAARLTRRPFNSNYHAHFHTPYHTSFQRQPGFYGRPIEGNGQPSPPAGGQDESNPSKLIDDQNQGQSVLGGYEYGPHFHYKPPYYGGFYPGFNEFPYHNASFNPGNVEQVGGNSSDGQPPYGPPYFPDYKFNPYFPQYPSFYPNFYGHRRPVEPQNPPENSGNVEQTAQPENGQADVNGTVGKRPPYGFPPYGPYYGDFHLPGYPLVGFNGVPYHFNHGFHHHLFPHFKVGPYSHFPLGPWYPHFGAHYNGRGGMAMPEKPVQGEKTAPENAEGPPANSEAEMISESKVDTARYEKPSSWPFNKETNKPNEKIS